MDAAGAVTAVVPVETLAADTAPTVAPAQPSGPAPVSVPRSLSHPIPALPDWAFVSTRFGAARTPESATESVSDDSSAEADRAAVPTHVPDLRDASFGAPGSVATQTVSSQSKAIAPVSGSGLRVLRRHTGLRLVVGAALVLVAALAVAPRPKATKPAGRTRIGAVVSPEARPAPSAAVPSAVSAPARTQTSTPAYPVMFGPEPPPSSERVVSSR
jgi:hypothetical protein